MYNSARLAAELARQQLPQVSIEIVDSGTATVGEGLIVTAAARAVVAGKSLAEAAQIARSISGHVRVGGVLDDISHVYRTGRIPQLPAKVGAWLNIKPAFTLARGKIRVSGVFRSTEKGIDRLLSTMRKSGDSRPVHVAVAHAAVPDEGEKLQKGIESEFNCVESWLTDFSPVMAYAPGRSAGNCLLFR
jgi:DegV family protein with EDD domain